MKNVKLRLVIAMVLGVGLAGCASQPQLSREQIHDQHQAISRLDQAVQQAQTRNMNLLAPESMTNAEAQLAEAYAAAEKGKVEPADRAAALGLSAMEKAEANARTSADILAEVLDSRDKAVKAGAKDLFSEDLARLDEDLKKTSNLIEKGNQEKAKQERPELRQAYSSLELKSLKEGTVQRARAAIDRAKENDAHKLAPKTFKGAQDSLAVASSVLETDRTARDRAEAAAQRALILAERSENIAEVVKDFDRRDYTKEDMVLWYQDQVTKINAPLNTTRLFNEPNKQTVAAIQQDIASVVQEKERLVNAAAELKEADSRVALIQQQRNQEVAALKAEHEKALAQMKTQNEQTIAALKTQHAQELGQLETGFAGKEAEMTMAQKQAEERFARLQKLFDKGEATVYRQGDNVLITVQGFKFPAGSSEIQPQNFATMNKLVESIATFPGAKIEIAGHTDATGGDEINQALSKKRADSVAKFLNEVGKISQDKIVSEGYGSQRPVASNATPEGRALNRRIDVVIVNEE